MALKRTGLGRGLDALLSMGAKTALDEEQADLPLDVRKLPIELVQRSRFQPRLEIRPEALEELASSIRVQGVVQPIVVRPLDGGFFELIAGERRWRASQLAGLHEIPAIVRDLPDQSAMSIALIENIQREDLNPLEEALALNRLVNEFALTHQEIAEAIGRSRAAVSNLLRLLDLQDDVKRMLESGDLEMGHARALLALEGQLQSEVARQVVAQGLSVRETERLVQRHVNPPPGKAETAPPDANVRDLEEKLSGTLGARVSVKHDRKGKGSLVIRYNSLDELDGILAHIK